jgi:hypothetical protein
MNKDKHTRSHELASQAASMPIFNSRFFQRGLLDGLTPAQNVQNWLSVCTNGKPSHLLPFQCSIIHNCRLSIVLSGNMIHCGSQTIISDPSCLLSSLRAHAKNRLSGTRPELRQAVQPRSWEVRKTVPLGIGAKRRVIDRASYNPTKKTRGPLAMSPYTHSLVFGSCLTTALSTPVWRTGHALSPWRCSGARRSPAGRDHAAASSPEREVCL